MNKDSLQLKEAKDYLKLAKVYHDIAKCRDNKKEHWRGVVDADYNSAELCIKGLLKLKMLEIPSSHGGVVRKFSQYYILTGIVAKKYGRILNKSLRLRNLARYECSADIDEREIKDVNGLTKAMIKILEIGISKAV
ncbi:hypothetical protein A2Y83_01670 [Candidatus Falkowbacteria bacterium RBG_13_39_14]|uniref:HEPN domain-containing protein n=1 Tax=Candidatus Falkowbacteria bacterium RBG_13_39_14 TaxID=1797985 RepID=A0A1F5S1Q8_9BACT|nr:MAG: hypothetical protein A2Y83_01670 [Candidatus Falkowbacteria bacterium RBG_13_39_14]